MDTQEILLELMTGRTVTIEGDSAGLRVLAVTLLKKLQKYKSDMDRIGYLRDDLRNKTISSVFTDASKTATVLSLKVLRTRRTYKILKVELPNDSDVSTNLEHGEESTLQYGSSDPSAPITAEDSDSSSSQGEIHGERGTEEDWESQLRRFVEQGDSGQ